MKVGKILIFSFSHIGDALLSTAVIEPLKRHFPDALISVLIGPIAVGLLQGDKRVDELIIYDNKGIHAGLQGKIRLIKDLNARKFDLVVDLRDSFWARLVKGKYWGIGIFQRFTGKYRKSHSVDRYLSIINAHGVDIDGALPKICLLPSENDFAHEFLKSNGINDGDKVIGMHPGGGWTYKLWPVERFAALGDLLSHKYKAKILLFAGPEEAPLQDEMARLMKFPPIIVKDVGLRELTALIQHCHIYIGNDTGTTHIAASTATQVIAIFGPTNAQRIGPYGNRHTVVSEPVDCSPCHPGRRPGRCKLGYCKAIQAILVEKVAESVSDKIPNL